MSGIIYYWRAGSSYRQADETFSRSGSRYQFNDKTGLYEEVADGVPRTSSWVHATDGNTYRTLELALGDTPKNSDSARFEPANTAWSDIGSIASQAAASSIIAGLPTNGEARKFVTAGASTDDIRLRHTIGSSTGAKECAVAIIERGDMDVSRIFLIDDTGAYLNVEYDWTTDTLTLDPNSLGSGDAAWVEGLLESGPNGGKTILLAGVGTGNNTTGRLFDVMPVFNQANATCYVHYAAAHELAFNPGINPYVGSPVAAPAEQFSVSPGPYRSDVVQAWYVECVAGTLIGEAGTFNPILVDHGDGTNPRVRVRESAAGAGQYFLNYVDANGNTTGGNAFVDIGTSDPLQRVEVVYAFDPSDGKARIVGRADGGSVDDSGTQTPSNWTTPTGLGADNRIAYNEAGSLDGTNRSHNFYRRHLGVLGPNLDNDPLTGGASAVMDEMANLAELND